MISNQPIGTKENPCTPKNSELDERLNKYCLCDRCKLVGLCTPVSDYFESDWGDGKVLECEPCHHRSCGEYLGGRLIPERFKKQGWSSLELPAVCGVRPELQAATAREALQKLLLYNGRDNEELVREAMDAVEPLLASAESGKYQFSSVQKTDRMNLIRIYEAAMEEPVDEVISLPLFGTIPDLGQVDARISPCIGFGRCLSWRRRKALPESVRLRLDGWLREHILRAINVSLKRSLKDSPWINLPRYQSYVHDLLGGLERIFNYYFGFVLAGDEERIKRMTPFMQLLPKALPIGHTFGEPHTWYVAAG